MDVLTLEQRIRSVFNIPPGTLVSVQLHNESGAVTMSTMITVGGNETDGHSCIIPKPPEEVTLEDIRALRESLFSALEKRHPVRAALFRLFGWWVIFGGSLAIFSICPLCGRPGCLVGVGTTGVLAGLLALMKQYGVQALSWVRRMVGRNMREGPSRGTVERR